MSESPPGGPLPLDRISRALVGAAAAQTQPAAPSTSGASRWAQGFSVAALTSSFALGLIALTSGHPWMWLPSAGCLAAGAAAAALRGGKSPSLPASSTQAPSIGMGASIASGTTLEPGVTVEMGASVSAGAVLKRGATIKMGAHVGKRAVIEEGAVISWGVSVGSDAVVGAGAFVGSGSSVAKGARVPPNLRLSPGTAWRSTYSSEGAPALPGAAAPVAIPPPAAALPLADPRAERINANCDRLETELAQASPAIQEHLGTSIQSVAALRKTCHQLLAREKEILQAADPRGIPALDDEAAALEKRIAEVSDAAIGNSLRGAVAAIRDQKRQRELLQRSAERIDAEVTRLTWTLEGLGTQLLRLRTLGAEAAAAGRDEVLKMTQQLHDEIDAIADALEHVNGTDRLVSQVVEVESPPDGGGGDGSHVRQRS